MANGRTERGHGARNGAWAVPTVAAALLLAVAPKVAVPRAAGRCSEPDMGADPVAETALAYERTEPSAAPATKDRSERAAEATEAAQAGEPGDEGAAAGGEASGAGSSVAASPPSSAGPAAADARQDGGAVARATAGQGGAASAGQAAAQPQPQAEPLDVWDIDGSYTVDYYTQSIGGGLVLWGEGGYFMAHSYTWAGQQVLARHAYVRWNGALYRYDGERRAARDGDQWDVELQQWTVSGGHIAFRTCEGSDSVIVRYLECA